MSDPLVPPAAAIHPDTGQRFGRFLLQECIGRGGMAEVFRAVAQGVEGFQRVFVVKRIHKEKSANPALRDMFVNEARLSALLNHPNIVQVYDFGLIDDCYFISMEYLRGKDLLLALRQLRASGRVMPASLAAYIAREVAAGLAYAHELKGQGGKELHIVHRDVSPSNILLLRAGGVKLLDFGIAKASAALIDGGDGHATLTGLIKGKLSYLSPEQVRNEPVDARSDIFSLGVVLWECLTGKRLFYDKADYHTMNNVLERPVPPPSTQRPGIEPALDFITVRALERAPDHRYQSARTLADDLDHYLAESRFRPSLLPRMLDELFGRESSTEVESLPVLSSADFNPGTSADDTPVLTPMPVVVAGAGAAASAATSGSNLPALRSSTRSDGLLPAASAAGEGRAGPSSGEAQTGSLEVTGMLGRLERWAAQGTVVYLVAGALIIAAFTGGLLLRRPPPDLERAGLAAPVVRLRVETDPPGADVRDAAGRALGRTPFTVELGRSSAALVLTFRKEGFQDVRQSLVPDRDLASFVMMRPAPAPVR